MRRGVVVLPLGPFVRSHVERHPEYLHLVLEDRRAGSASEALQGLIKGRV
jgi:hypothetical protein